MKRRELKGPSTDLLVCFPTRSHLTLMPKTICSPSRSSKTYNHGGKSSDGGDRRLWSKRNQMGLDQISEPTSPKVTCAGQIKARPRSKPCKNWQTVMEEIERLHNHNNKKYRKKPSWSDALGFKKDSMQFLTSLRSFKFDLGCFSAFPNANATSDDDDDGDNDNDEDDEEINHLKKLMGFERYDHDEDLEERSSKSAFSKLFMFLEENQDCGLHAKEEFEKPKYGDRDDDDDDDGDQVPCVPPSNALLLMRCRSTPTKSLFEEKEEDGNDDDNDEEHKDNDDGDDNDKLDQYNDGKKTENLMELMNYEGNFYKLSCDIAKETWVVAGINKDQCSKTQSSQRSSTECLEEVKACLQ